MPGFLGPLLSNPLLSAFVVNLVTTIGWDGTKAIYSSVTRKFLPSSEEVDARLEEEFRNLSASEQIHRHAQHILAEIQRRVGDTDAEGCFSYEVATDALTSTLIGETGTGQSVSETIVQAISEKGVNADRSEVCRMTAIVLVALVQSELLPLIQLRTTELTVEGIARQQDELAELKQVSLNIESGVKRLLSGHDSTGSPVRPPTDFDRPDASGLSHALKEDERSFLGVDDFGREDSLKDDSCTRPEHPCEHVARPAAVRAIQDALAENPAIAITGYHGCGKSTAISELADECKRDHVWVHLESSDNTTNKCTARIRHAVSRWLQLETSSEGDLANALTKAASESPRLIVIDNAELLEDLREIEFVLKSCQEARGGLWLVLGYADDPAFTQSVQLARVRSWRLPGMSIEEAKKLYAEMGVEDVEPFQTVISLLCTQCDGHIGLLRLCRHLVGRHLSAEDIQALIDLRRSEAIRGATAAVVESFIQALPEDALRLCRMTSVCSHSFSQELAAQLWNREDEAFGRAWSYCDSTVFEHDTAGRRRIPYLYRAGLGDLLSTGERRRLHALAAEHLRIPPDGAARTDDAYSCVVHDIAAGNSDCAVRDAICFAWMARHSQRLDIVGYLFPQFDEVLTSSSVLKSTSALMQIRWASFGILVARDLDRAGLLRECLGRVRRIIDDHGNEITESERQWATTNPLWCASHFKNIELAWESWDLLLKGRVRVSDRDMELPLISLVFHVYLSSEGDMTEFCERVFDWVENHRDRSSEIWDDADCLQMWRLVGGKLAAAVGKVPATDTASRDAKVREFLSCIVRARELGLAGIAYCLEASYVVHLIDVDRNFTEAASRATALAVSQEWPRQMRAYLCTVAGDAFRCAGELATAEEKYREASLTFDTSSLLDLSNAAIGLSTCQFRRGRRQFAAQTLRDAHAVMSQRPSTEFGLDYSSRVRTALELSVVLMHCEQMDDCVSVLADAHELLTAAGDHGAYWVVLAQLAVGLQHVLSGQQSADEVAFPGFSFGLPGSIPESEDMLPYAPTLALAFAFDSVGRTDEAIGLYESAREQIHDADARWMNDWLGFWFAVRESLLVPVVRYGFRMCDYSPDTSKIRIPDEPATLLREHVLPNVASIAITHCRTPIAYDSWDECRLLGNNQRGTAESFSNLLRRTVEGIFEAATSENTATLEEAYSSAIECDALSLARELAFAWCFRAAQRRRSYVDIVTWFFRLTWLTQATSHTDENFLRLIQNCRTYWNSFTMENPPAVVNSIRQLVAEEPGDAAVVVDQIAAELGESLRKCGWKAFFQELSAYFSSGERGTWVDGAIATVLREMAGFVCVPDADGTENQIQKELAALRSAVERLRNDDSEQAQQWMEVLERLELVCEFNFGTLPASEEVVKALLELRPLLEGGLQFSQVNWYFLTKQAQLMVQGNLSPPSPELYDVLCLESVMDFVDAARGLDDRVAMRLKLLGADTDCRQAFARFVHSAKVARMKARAGLWRPGMPSEATELLTATRDRLDECFAELSRLIQQCRDEDEWSAEVEEGLFVRGSTMWLASCQAKAVGDEIASWGEVLENEGREQFAEVRELALARGADETDPRLAFISSTTSTAMLGEARRERSGDDSLLVMPGRGEHESVDLSEFTPDELVFALDSFDVSAMARVIAETHGIDDDCLSVIEFDQTQHLSFLRHRAEFCTHLIGEWASCVSNSPEAAYMRHPEYVCYCDKLGKRTTIPAPDADTAVKSMVMNNCEGCVHQAPIIDPAVKEPTVKD